MQKYLNLRPNIALVLVFAFLANTLGPVPLAQAQSFYLPAPGTMVALSPAFNPPILKGLKVDPNNPFRFDFILDTGEIGDSPQLRNRGQSPISPFELKAESLKLIKYFLASLTIPENDLWVNLSPYEKNRIIPQSFGLTEMGRDLLAEDYMLKQITASLIYPEGETGRKFWKHIYAEATKRFGTTNVPVNTFNKVWIVPEKAVVYENVKAGTAYVVEAKLKVMLEEDYLAMAKEKEIGDNPQFRKLGTVPDFSSQIIRQIVIPELNKEVNDGQNFAQLRQVYNSLILATWYKKKIKDSILAQVYEDQKKVSGVDYGRNDTEVIYQRYLQAFKKGCYNYIKEDIDPTTQQSIPRKYFSGGASMYRTAAIMNTVNNLAMVHQGHSQGLEEIHMRIDPAMNKPSEEDISETRRQFGRALYEIGYPNTPEVSRSAIERLRQAIPILVNNEEYFQQVVIDKIDEEFFPGRMEGLLVLIEEIWRYSPLAGLRILQHTLQHLHRYSNYTIPGPGGRGTYQGEIYSHLIVDELYVDKQLEIASKVLGIDFKEWSQKVLSDQNASNLELREHLTDVLLTLLLCDPDTFRPYLNDPSIRRSLVQRFNYLLTADRLKYLFSNDLMLQRWKQDRPVIVSQLKQWLGSNQDRPAIGAQLKQWLGLNQGLEAAPSPSLIEERIKFKAGLNFKLLRVLFSENIGHNLQPQLLKLFTPQKTEFTWKQVQFNDVIVLSRNGHTPDIAVVTALYPKYDGDHGKVIGMTSFNGVTEFYLNDSDLNTVEVRNDAGSVPTYDIVSSPITQAHKFTLKSPQELRELVDQNQVTDERLVSFIRTNFAMAAFKEAHETIRHIAHGAKVFMKHIYELGTVEKAIDEFEKETGWVDRNELGDDLTPFTGKEGFTKVERVSKRTAQLLVLNDPEKTRDFFEMLLDGGDSSVEKISDFKNIDRIPSRLLPLWDRIEKAGRNSLAIRGKRNILLNFQGKARSISTMAKQFMELQEALDQLPEIKHYKKALPQWDNPQWQQVAGIIAAPERSPFHISDIFRDEMTQAIVNADTARSHRDIFYSIARARLKASYRSLRENKKDWSAEIYVFNAVARNLLKVENYERSGGGHSNAADGDARLNDLYHLANQRIISPYNLDGYVYFETPIPGSFRKYKQVFSRGGAKIHMYHVPYKQSRAVMRALGILWKRILKNPNREDQYKALAEYEWWFFQGNLLGRGGAAMGDAMSIIAQRAIGIPLRTEYRNMDFNALSLPLERYISLRVEELKKQDMGDFRNNKAMTSNKTLKDILSFEQTVMDTVLPLDASGEMLGDIYFSMLKAKQITVDDLKIRHAKADNLKLKLGMEDTLAQEYGKELQLHNPDAQELETRLKDEKLPWYVTVPLLRAYVNLAISGKEVDLDLVEAVQQRFANTSIRPNLSISLKIDAIEADLYRELWSKKRISLDGIRKILKRRVYTYNSIHGMLADAYAIELDGTIRDISELERHVVEGYKRSDYYQLLGLIKDLQKRYVDLVENQKMTVQELMEKSKIDLVGRAAIGALAEIYIMRLDKGQDIDPDTLETWVKNAGYSAPDQREGIRILAKLYKAMWDRKKLSTVELEGKIRQLNTHTDDVSLREMGDVLSQAYVEQWTAKHITVNDLMRMFREEPNSEIRLALLKAIGQIYAAMIRNEKISTQDSRKFLLMTVLPPYQKNMIEDYWKSGNPQEYLEAMRVKDLEAITNGFDYNDENQVISAYRAVRAHGIDTSWTEFKERLDKLKEYDQQHPGSFAALFDKAEGWPSLKILSPLLEKKYDQVNGDVFSAKWRELTGIKKNIDQLTWLENFKEDKKFDLKNIYFQMERREALKKKKLKEGERFSTIIPDTEAELRQKIAANKPLFYETIFTLTYNKWFGQKNSPQAAVYLDLMRDIIIAEVLEDTHLAEQMNSDDMGTKMVAFKNNFSENYINHLPDSVGLSVGSISGLKERFEALAKDINAESAKVRTRETGKFVEYSFVPQGFISVFRGRIGEGDCSYYMEDRGYPFTRAMHEDTAYYFSYKDKQLTGYLGLMWAQDPEGKKVLTIDTIQDPGLNDPQALTMLLDQLNKFALSQGAIGVALPKDLKPYFNFDNKNIIHQLPLYTEGRQINLKPVHEQSWKDFDTTFGKDTYNSIEDGRFVQLNFSADRDKAMNARNNGGIDLTPARMNLQTKVMDSRFRGNDSDEGGNDIRFHLDPAMLAQLRNARGFVPVITDMRPMANLDDFLETPAHSR